MRATAPLSGGFFILRSDQRQYIFIRNLYFISHYRLFAFSRPPVILGMANAENAEPTGNASQ